MPSPRRSWLFNPWVHLALILLIAGFFRLWQIGSLPPGLFGDEATDGLDALDVLAGHGSVFFPANYGREGLHIWLVAAAFRLLGITPLALRLPSVIAGTLTALATYWLGAELFAAGRRKTAFAPLDPAGPRLGLSIALVAALYLATSYWHVHFSRFGIRGVFTPLCAALAFAALWRGINCGTGSRTSVIPEGQPQRPRPPHSAWFATSGFFLGLSLHFYTASRFLPFFLAGFLALQWVVALVTGQRHSALLPRYWRALLLLYGVAGLVFAPLGVYFLQHPGSFSQRASTVAAFGSSNPWLRVAQAATANTLQFFLPGGGDQAQFYNLPGRAVFDVPTALLALVGIGVLLYRWRRPEALFLLTWWPAMLVPSFLATDRYPTLPRVLGSIPGVYFFPAVGLLAVTLAAGRLVRRLRKRSGNAAAYEGRPTAKLAVPLAMIVVALTCHALLTYRDYFLVWGPSPATYDAFEGDMTAAWQWLETHQAQGHVYLSSDIYRHPTFMLLHEHATVSTYFEHQNAGLSWFDARASLPLPAPGQPATYLLAESSPPAGQAAAFLSAQGIVLDSLPGPGGTRGLVVIDLPAGAAWPESTDGPVAFTPSLELIGARWVAGPNGEDELWLEWQTGAAEPDAWPGYRLELAGTGATGAGWQISFPFDAYRGPEWVPGGRFVSWHSFGPDVFSGAPPATLRLRLLRLDDGTPAGRPEAPDGWHQIELP